MADSTTPTIGSPAYWEEKLKTAQNELNTLQLATPSLLARWKSYEMLGSKGAGLITDKGGCGLKHGCSQDDIDAYHSSQSDYNSNQTAISNKQGEIVEIKKSLAKANDTEPTAQENNASQKSKIIGTNSRIFIIGLLIIIVIGGLVWYFKIRK